jgi:hypothetical protein
MESARISGGNARVATPGPSRAGVVLDIRDCPWELWELLRVVETEAMKMEEADRGQKKGRHFYLFIA